MEEIERIDNTINRVAPSVSPIGRNDPTALSTKKEFVYRETGIDQIEDIINCGYVRSNIRRKSNQVWWTIGGENSFHVNKRPILVASSNVVTDGKKGAITIDDLCEIWLFDEKQNKFVDKIDEIRLARQRIINESITSSKKLDSMSTDERKKYNQTNNNKDNIDYSIMINQIKNQNIKISNEYKSMMSDGYISDDELAVLINRLNELSNNAKKLKSLITDKNQEAIIDSIIDTINKESVGMETIQKKNEQENQGLGL